MSAATFGEVYAALVRVMGTPDEVSPGCVAWLAPDRAGAGLTLQLLGRALVLSVIEPSTPRAHEHWTLAGAPTRSAPPRTPDEAIPEAVTWLLGRGVVMWTERCALVDPLGSRCVLRPKHGGSHLIPGPTAPTTTDVPRCGGERGFSRCSYAKGHPGPCSFQHADYLGGYDR